MTDITDWTEEQLSPYSNFDDIWPDWAPDGQTVYYCQVQPGSNPFLVKLGVQNNKFGQERRVLPPGPDISFPIASAIASPDSNWLIFESWPDGINRDIYMMDIYGSNLRRLTTSPAYDFSPAWRPVIKKP
jgi:Tol biopolymer transport system component